MSILDEYLHGVEVVEINSGSQTISTVATSVIGVVCTGDAADAETFPLNTPVLLLNPLNYLEKAGKTGTLKRTLNSIGSIVRTPTVVVRVSESEDSDTLTANVVGTQENGKFTGLKALLTAQSMVFVKPKLLAAPGLDNQTVATELITISKKLNAFCFVSDNGATTKEQAVAYARNFSAREVMMIWSDWQSFNTDTKTYDVDYATARAVAVQAWIDKNIGWHKNISNVEVDGVTGITKPVDFDINESSTDANFLNSKNITVCLNDGGFKYWGSRTLSSDTRWAFQQATRTAQIIKETIGAGLKWVMDQPITVLRVKMMIDAINSKLRQWASGDDPRILGARVWVAEEITADIIKSGKFLIKYDYHWIPSLESLGLEQRVNDEYVVDLANELKALSAGA
ncbi:phage tail sheath protein [Actinobacillus lignieresii]|uniref:Phage tail sheath protein n=1 Tax=Actinobacillus lignieresii TaxID=720 RepID=A0A380TV07_ACTLI|nr:phage tail sheath protein [Actinobacillus lignieresii]SUT91522.1 Phage tail sheath protein [Actinobacillus lignieresii]